MKYSIPFKLATVGIAVTVISACGGGGGGGGSDAGTLKVALTDAPACGYDEVNVTIQKVRVNQSSSASDDAAGWSEITLNPARRVNLLNLTNGVLEELGQTPLPTGKYTQLRMILAENTSGSPLANSVKPTGAAEVALRTPSGQQSGVKTNVNIDVAANQLADFVLDFDACKSVVVAGNSGQYLLKPVVSVIPRFISGVAGFVDAGLASGSTSVSLQQAGVVVKATAPDATGRFVLQPVAPGNYSLVLTAPGRATGVVTNVPVAANVVTSLAPSTAALNLPVSASGTLNGTAPVDTLMRALQPLTGTTTVEVIGRFVDGVSGAYSFSLPVNSPVVAPYAAPPSPLVFLADGASAGRYTLSASKVGFADKMATPAALTASSTVTTNFTFP